MIEDGVNEVELFFLGMLSLAKTKKSCHLSLPGEMGDFVNDVEPGCNLLRSMAIATTFL